METLRKRTVNAIIEDKIRIHKSNIAWYQEKHDKTEYPHEKRDYYDKIWNERIKIASLSDLLKELLAA